MKKVWYKSKTLWVALFVFVGSVANEAFGMKLNLEENGAFIGGAVAIAMFILRLFTDEGVKLKDEK